MINIIKEIKSINANKHPVSSILLLSDNRIAYSSNENYAIKILNPDINYKCEASLLGHANFVNSISQLNDNNIASCSNDYSIKIWSLTSYQCIYTISNAHRSYVLKVIPLSLNRFATCAGSSEIKIWNVSPPYSDTPIKVLVGICRWVTCLLYLHSKDSLISGSRDDILCLWNMKTYQCVSVIEGGNHCWCYEICMIDEMTVIVGYNSLITIINVNDCKKENEFYDEDIEYIQSFVNIGKEILCGGKEGKLTVINKGSNRFRIVKTTHKNVIDALIILNENTLISGSWDETIKIWSINE